ncbi:zwei Ig domain protein zig-8-like isoform X2 [Venturia canescens]|uniref:zwei Ig domain protein zig-8-like isoform X2 n=1 Tax=Venturia canescens TaxID=32260 RepID=UPI001C9BD6F9|nr:zwei Ig domain protein zig-8-like isoform X2 [Venturia canescens]
MNLDQEHPLYEHFHVLEQFSSTTRRKRQRPKQINVQLPPLRVPHLRHHHVTHWGPYFENAEGQWINGSQHVGLHLGATAMLDCRVAMLDKRTVMWVRKIADRPSLLTLGREVHITDPRYSVNFQYPNNWRLAISSVQKEDRGQYVCEVNTHPPTMLVTNVTVLAPDIRVVDEASHELRDRYYKTGSAIELACIVKPAQPDSQVPHPTWKKAGDPLPEHVKVYHINGSNDELITGLRIDRAKKIDSGEYTCSLGQFTSTIVYIHVLNGEKQAAVHHDQWNAAKTNYDDEARRGLFTVLTVIQLFLYATHSSYSTIYSL